MSTSTLIAQLRIALQLTHTEIQVAETRVVQARTEAVRRELTQNAANGRDRAAAIESRFESLRESVFGDLGDDDLRAALRVLRALQAQGPKGTCPPAAGGRA